MSIRDGVRHIPDLGNGPRSLRPRLAAFERLCWFMTDVKGIGVPFEDPEHRVVTYSPTYGEWVGTIYDDGDGKVWDAVVHCGEDGESLFS